MRKLGEMFAPSPSHADVTAEQAGVPLEEEVMERRAQHLKELRAALAEADAEFDRTMREESSAGLRALALYRLNRARDRLNAYAQRAGSDLSG